MCDSKTKKKKYLVRDTPAELSLRGIFFILLISSANAVFCDETSIKINILLLLLIIKINYNVRPCRIYVYKHYYNITHSLLLLIYRIAVTV